MKIMYSEEQKKEIIESIFLNIEDGISTRKAIVNNNISSSTFFRWMDDNEELSKQYARACELRAEALLDEMLDIVDDSSQDKTIDDLDDEIKIEKTNHEAIQRSRLRYDARKWLISKLNPKKYGDKIEVDQNTNMTISWNQEKTYEK